MITVPAIVMVGILPIQSDIQPKIRDPSNKPDVKDDKVHEDTKEDAEVLTKHSEGTTESSEVGVVTDDVPLHGHGLREVGRVVGPHVAGRGSVVVIPTSRTESVSSFCFNLEKQTSLGEVR